MRVKKLLVRTAHCASLTSVDFIDYGPDGIVGAVACAPFRQVLLASASVTADCGLKDGDLRENVVVDCDELYDLPSGTVVQIGEALIRLPFHCEPCQKILKLVDLKTILHRRGVFGTFLNSGRMRVNDAFAVTEQQLEAIPNPVGERLRWLLERHGASAALTDLAHTVGLPASYNKALPKLLQRICAPG